MRTFVCLLAIAWGVPASAQFDGAHCLRQGLHKSTHPHVCTGTPRTDHAGSSRIPR